MGITWAGGTAPIIIDDGVYSFGDISSAFPTALIDLGTTSPSYRATVSIQIGATAGAATTTLEEKLPVAVFFDATRSITRGNPASSANISMGTKVGSGTTASGKKGVVLKLGASATWSGMGSINLYGCHIHLTPTSGTAMTVATAGSTDWQNCIFHTSNTGAGSFTLGGGSGTSLGTIYNCDFSGDTTTSFPVAQMYATACERVTISATAPLALLSLSVPTVTAKDAKFIGTPTASDIRVTAAAQSCNMVRPVWSGNAPKYSISSGSQLAAVGLHEYWQFGLKVVDGTGKGISGIPVTLTDCLGNKVVDDELSNEVVGGAYTGNISFGSGLLANAVIVMDHYGSAGPPAVYSQLHRSPFYCEINTGPSRNPNYNSRQFYFYWPGFNTVTDSAGTFRDVFLVINLQEPSGGATSWVECEMP